MKKYIWMMCVSTILLSTLNVTGCATVFTGEKTNIALNTSDGKKVDVEVSSASGVQTLTIPSSIIVDRSNQPIHVKIKDKECGDTSVTVPNKINTAFYANFLFGIIGTTSAGVDSSSGAMWTYDENIIVPVTRTASPSEKE